MENIAALSQEDFEAELGVTAAGWRWHQQLVDPQGSYGGGHMALLGVGEVYRRFISHELAGPPAGQETLVFWWTSPKNIGKVIKNGREYPNPTEAVIRMLVK